MGAGVASTAPGDPDTTFNEAVAVAAAGGLNNLGRSVAVDPDGKLVVTGGFTNAGGTTGVNRLARFDSDPVVAHNPPGPPVVKKPQSLRAGTVPKRIKPRGSTVVNKHNAKTRQGRALTAKVQVTGTRGEVTCFRLIKGKQRKLTIRTTGQCTMRVTVTYTAPGNSTYRGFKKVVTYRVMR